MGCLISKYSGETWRQRYEREEKRKLENAKLLQNASTQRLQRDGCIGLLRSYAREKDSVITNNVVCEHPYVFKSNGVYRCYDCGVKLNQMRKGSVVDGISARS